mmetsp:Transcript_109536/g.349460  ORF Transcript_109536/g.349460 Transcript_109536/m.349460 type:complete len:214 (-) Transcript_109536:77-718(-)
MSFRRHAPSARPGRGLAGTTSLLAAATLAALAWHAPAFGAGLVAGLGPHGGRLVPCSARGVLVVRRAEGEFQMGQTVQGTVARLDKSGAVLDLGLSKQGWLHVGKIQKERVDKIGNVLSVGQKVEVRVLKDNPGKKVDVSMAAKGLKGQSDFEVGQELEATVVDIVKRGLFLEVGAVREAFMPSGQATKGQRMKVRITKMCSGSSAFEVQPAN